MSAPTPRRFDFDETLVLRVQSGDRQAFFRLVRPHENTIFTVGWAFTGSEQLGEEVAQEAVLKAWLNFREYSVDACFRTWLVEITVRQTRAALSSGSNNRKHVGAVTTHYSPSNFEPWQELPAGMLEEVRFRKRLQQALLALPAQCREVFVLRDMIALPVLEAARILGLEQAVAKQYLSHARLQFRDAMAGAIAGDNPAVTKRGER